MSMDFLCTDKIAGMPEAANEEMSNDELSPAIKRVMKQRQVIAALAGIALNLLLRLLPHPTSPPRPVALPHPFEIVNYLSSLWYSSLVQLTALSVFTFLSVYRWCYPRAWLFAFLAGLGWTGVILTWLMRG
jgi:hypothetical protein